MAAKGLGIAVIVISFCLIAIFSRHEALKQPSSKAEHRESMIHYTNREPEGGAEFRLLKRDGQRYAVYGTIDRPREVRLAQRILKRANWQDAKVHMEREPDYKIETVRARQPFTYDIWLTPRRNIEMVIEGKSKYVKLGDEESRSITALLESSYAKRWNPGDDRRRPIPVPEERRAEIEG